MNTRKKLKAYLSFLCKVIKFINFTGTCKYHKSNNCKRREEVVNILSTKDGENTKMHVWRKLTWLAGYVVNLHYDSIVGAQGLTIIIRKFLCLRTTILKHVIHCLIAWMEIVIALDFVCEFRRKGRG